MLQLFRNHSSRPTTTVASYTSSSSRPSSLFTTLFGQHDDAKENGDILALTLAGNHKVGFEDILYIIKHHQMSSSSTKNKKHPSLSTAPYRHYWLVNTLPVTQQDVLIPHTIPCHGEEDLVNNVLNDLSKNPHQYCIVIYGKNNTDDTVDKKYKQFLDFGFIHVFIYYGGLFEWTLLQDVYGSEHFPTTKETSGGSKTATTVDLLHWSPSAKLL